MTDSEHKASKTRVAGDLALLGEYIKNLSFESPQALEFLKLGQRPELEVDVDVGVAQQNENLYEVTLNLEVHAKYEVDVIYHLELSYGGLFRLRKIPQELRQQVLIGNCPKLLFPSFRRVVSDITHHGGFPPLMLNFGSFSGLAKAAILAQKERRVDSAQEATHILAECQRE